MGFDIEWQSATIHNSGNERFAASSSSWPGKVALSLIEHWEAVQNLYLYIPGLITTANAILEEFKRQTGGKEWIAGKVSVEDILREAEGRFARGFPDAGIFLLERSVLFDDEGEGLGAVRPFVVEEGEEDWKGKLGLEGERLEGIVEGVLHDFREHGKGGCGCD